jgi:hypothetical protein
MKFFDFMRNSSWSPKMKRKYTQQQIRALSNEKSQPTQGHLLLLSRDMLCHIARFLCGHQFGDCENDNGIYGILMTVSKFSWKFIDCISHLDLSKVSSTLWMEDAFPRIDPIALTIAQLPPRNFPLMNMWSTENLRMSANCWTSLISMRNLQELTVRHLTTQDLSSLTQVRYLDLYVRELGIPLICPDELESLTLKFDVEEDDIGYDSTDLVQCPENLSYLTMCNLGSHSVDFELNIVRLNSSLYSLNFDGGGSLSDAAFLTQLPLLKSLNLQVVVCKAWCNLQFLSQLQFLTLPKNLNGKNVNQVVETIGPLVSVRILRVPNSNWWDLAVFNAWTSLRSLNLNVTYPDDKIEERKLNALKIVREHASLQRIIFADEKFVIKALTLAKDT